MHPDRFLPVNRVLAEARPFDPSGGVTVLVGHRSPETGRWFHAVPMQMQEAEPNIVPAPTFAMTREAAQELMDRLWQCGIRPSEGSGSAGQLAATRAHLEDMRALVFKTAPTA
jgi:hypothetical protein